MRNYSSILLIFVHNYSSDANILGYSDFNRAMNHSSDPPPLYNRRM